VGNTSAEYPTGFLDGVRAFNRGDFFEAHEAFEDLLDTMEADQRWDLLLALIQVSVGYHKWASGHAGALRMLSLGAEKLADFPPLMWGVDMEALRQRVAADRATLARDGAAPGRLETDLPRIRLQRPA
jgi:predicted metal-dependent hydrolase